MTGEANHTAAVHAADEWLRAGIPGAARGQRRVEELLDIGTALSIIRRVPLTLDDAERIIRILKDRQLVETAVVKTGPDSEPLIAFLERFWDYESSPYVRERFAHGQRIGKRHCYDMAMWGRTY